jgi:hypothetical protein
LWAVVTAGQTLAFAEILTGNASWYAGGVFKKESVVAGLAVLDGWAGALRASGVA